MICMKCKQQFCSEEGYYDHIAKCQNAKPKRADAKTKESIMGNTDKVGLEDKNTKPKKQRAIKGEQI